jgi:hypothetical protein
LPEDEDDDENFLMKIEHGAKMVLLMDILKECEILGDKVLQKIKSTEVFLKITC